ncbi:hypothetical protein [Rhizobium sp. BR 315]|uniref:hypothetical protein n=1 Tax=Rhizobium sp. BR 315 TaxID=3040014 RepID=UPI003D356A41
MGSHEILGGKVNVYRRGGLTWHCSASVKGRQYRTSTKETSLEQAKAFAEDWYLGLRGKLAAGILKTETTFALLAKAKSVTHVSGMNCHPSLGKDKQLTTMMFCHA